MKIKVSINRDATTETEQEIYRKTIGRSFLPSEEWTSKFVFTFFQYDIFTGTSMGISHHAPQSHSLPSPFMCAPPHCDIPQK